MPLGALLGGVEMRTTEGAPSGGTPTAPTSAFTDALTSAMGATPGAQTGHPATTGIVMQHAAAAALGARTSARGVRTDGDTPRSAPSSNHGAQVRALAHQLGEVGVPSLRALLGGEEGLALGRREALPAGGAAGADHIDDLTGLVHDSLSAAPGDLTVDSGARDNASGLLPTGPDLASLVGTDPALVAAFVPATPGMPITGSTEISSGSAASIPAAGALHPAFRDRLDRVIERMESEFGYRVEVVETLRSQDRQEALYRQGRSAPGPVVTWTRSSNHTEGLAADLLVDGSWSNRVAYDRLARIAREEGLRTLGPRDRGHVELPRTMLTGREQSALGLQTAQAHQPTTRGEAFFRAGAMASSGSPFRPTVAQLPTEGVARVATVAPVAHVASVAHVATVARVGGGVSRTAAFGSPSSMPDVAALPARPAIDVNLPAHMTAPGLVRQPREARAVMTDAFAQPVESLEGQPAHRVDARVSAAAAHATAVPSRDAGDEGRPRDSSKRDRESAPDRVSVSTANDRPDAALLRAFDLETRPGSDGLRLDSAESVLGSTAADRIAQLNELRDNAAERPMSSVLLKLDRPDGAEDRIRIGLRGTGVGAAFEMSDAGMAEDLGRHLADLARAMERQGLDPEAMTVRTLGMKDAPTGVSQAVAGERDALRAAAAGSTSNGSAAGREGRGASRQDHPHEESARQRPRRDPRGDR